MAKRGRVEERLAAIAALRDDPASAAAELRSALRSKVGLIAAAAAEIAGQGGLVELAPELEAAFARMCEEPIKRDPQCRAKVAIARALIELDAWSDEVFVDGRRWVQKEPVWGGTQDTAAELRGVCAIGCAQLRHGDAVALIADVLADRERVARLGAARALGDSGQLEAIPLLRFKARIGDDEGEVTAAVFASLIALDASDSVGLVASFLDGADEAVAEAAALSLGEARLEAAVAPLIAWCDAAVTDDRRRVGYLALALTRLDAATDYLLAAIAGEPGAALAVEALATFAYDSDLADRVRAAAAGNGDPDVAAAVAEAFST
jgi:hypothetical protein